MAALNRREVHRSAIARINAITRADDFEQKRMHEIKELTQKLENAYAKFEAEHILVVDTVEPNDQEGLRVQQELSDVVFKIYMEANVALNNRSEELISKQVEMDLSLHSRGRFSHLNLANRELNEPGPSMNLPNLNSTDLNSSEHTNANVTGVDEQAISAITRAVRSNRKLEVPPFSGDQAQWAEWKSCFENYVHNDPIYTDTEKFYYLKKSLKGVAADILKGWQTIGENYQVAYKSVVEVFENKYRMIMAHLNELFQLEHSPQETFAGLRKMIDTTNSVVRQLEIAGSPVQHWDHVIVYVLISRMPPRTLSFWENTNDLTEMPTLEEVLSFLGRRARSQVNFSLASNQNNNNLDNSSKKDYKQDKNQKQSNFSKTNNRKIPGSSEQRGVQCHNCKLPHPMYRCAKLLELPIQRRIDRAKELNLCLNCFSPNHGTRAAECRHEKCGRCKRGYHNAVLCMQNATTVNALVAYKEPIQTQRCLEPQANYNPGPSQLSPNVYRPTMENANLSRAPQLTVSSASATNFQ